MKSKALAASTAGAIVAAASMLLLGIAGNIGIYTGAVSMMQQWHMFFNLSVLGIFTGMIEAAVITFLFVYAFVWVYERLA